MVQLKDIFNELGATLQKGFQDRTIASAKAITDHSFDSQTIGWCSDKNAELLSGLTYGNVIVSTSVFEKMNVLSESLTLIPVKNPRLSFAKILHSFFVEKPNFGSISNSSTIDSTVKFDPSKVVIAANVVIEKGSIIGHNVIIGANTVIKSGTIIEENCSIGCNCTIGGIGFGYELNELNEYELVPHIGNVHLKSGVEIGNNVCVDRAVMGSTLLSENVKVDNLVHIAHGVQIGKNSLIIANAMIAGSVVIGENVWVAPSSSIRQKLELGNDSLIGLGSVVVKDVAPKTIVAGNPAKVLSKK
jgi:UDP-3-O-[3-hydroxymyristoyl] glucosamine N-acyltransferase